MRLRSRLYSIASKNATGVGSNTLFSSKSLLSHKPVVDVHPKTPVRTRFAPSPTGMLHMGSLRTALYNYLLARNTGGQFILRLEDTDRKRLVPEAEENIYESLQWCHLQYDEGPNSKNQKFGPYRQSERSKIYQEYVSQLLESKKAYRCFCSKERLDALRQSAERLQPPTNVTYDRHCLHLSKEQIEQNLENNVPYIVRFKSPKVYPTVHDLLHGTVNLQMQVNPNDVRYDDPVLMKSDGLPTYHLANVVDDHLMGITHVIRGEEWLPSTPKHLSFYAAFGWNAPYYVHIPLLMSTSDRKLSKRKGDAAITNFKSKGILPEALINFCVLFGWSPPRELASKKHECFTLEEFEKLFNLNSLVKGNAKVDEKKLWFFNKHHLTQQLKDPEKREQYAQKLSPVLMAKYPNSPLTKEPQIGFILEHCGSVLTTINEFPEIFYYFFERPSLKQHLQEFTKQYPAEVAVYILQQLAGKVTQDNINQLINYIASSDTKISKKSVFQTVRFALAGSHPGAKIALLVSVLGQEEANTRLQLALSLLQDL